MGEGNDRDFDVSTVAIIGAAGRFPGAPGLREFWNNLSNGRESVRTFTDEELAAAGETPEMLGDPSYVRACPVLDDIELFDAGFFGMSPRDAAMMDPQHRLFLETAWEAMEDAGYDPERTAGPVGVFAACGMNTYMMHHLVRNAEVMNTVGEWLARHTGNDMNFLATRVSYQMNLRGPSMNVQTACSSSLTAVHLACQSLQSGECDMALAGASTLVLPQDRGYLFKPGEILSRDGHCRPFDAASSGTLFGSGTGCVVLKRLEDALRDGDRVLGLVRGSAVNNDGSLKVGYLAPSVQGQAAVITDALSLSGIDAETITYIESHGTGTAMGDPIEIAALTNAFSKQTRRRQFCAIGSVKANIGHLGEAAGMAGLLKTLLAFEHRQIPPSINYEKPNPEIDFASSPVYVNTRLVPWEAKGPRRAGMTSLGAGGTNAHVVLEEAPSLEPSGGSRACQLVTLSARSEAALDRAAARLADHLRRNPYAVLADVAFTLNVGRKQFAHRRAFVASDCADAIAALETPDPKRAYTYASRRTTPSVVFMFPGGGAQYPGVGTHLYWTEPAYRTAFDECLAALGPAVAATLRRLVLDDPLDRDAASTELERPTLSLCSVFATSYSMAKLLESWGVEPAAMIGHSMGEYVAACLAQVLSLNDALALLELRGRLFESLAPGAMLVVPLSESQISPLLDATLSIAAVNAPELCVVSGPSGAIGALEETLRARELECSRVRIAVAAHSAMLDPFLGEFERFLRKTSLSSPRTPFMSNLTGRWIRPDEATDPLYWLRHLRHTVRFGDGIAEVMRGGERILLEVGPGRTLSSLARLQAGQRAVVMPTLRHPDEAIPDDSFLLHTLGKLWAHGTIPNFTRFYERERRHRVALPTYPFERQRYWIERGNPVASTDPSDLSRARRKKPDIADWFYLPSWTRSVLAEEMIPDGPWLVFTDDVGLGGALAKALEGRTLALVSPGWTYAKNAPDRYTVRPGHAADYVSLLDALEQSNRVPTHVIHLWGVTKPPRFAEKRDAWAELSRFDDVRELCFDSLLFLAKILDERENPTSLTVVSNDLLSLGNEPIREPGRAVLTGPVRVIPREMPHVRTRHVDIHFGHGQAARRAAARVIIGEAATMTDDRVVIRRGSERWTRSYDRVRLEESTNAPPIVRRRGVYLVTGGIGGIGLEIAEHFARVAEVRLVLVGRSPLPPESEWGAWLASHGDGDRTSHRIRKLEAIRALGSEVLTLAADVADRTQMEGVLRAARARFGEIHGLIHAAGVIDDGLIALKTKEAAAAVIGPKVKGALILGGLLTPQTLDFFMVFSSVSSILGLEGQVDYTAANAFLDAFAEDLADRGTRALAINWNAWREIGMAVTLADRTPPQSVVQKSQRWSEHPMLSRVESDSPVETVLSTAFSRRTHWLLAEHVIHGGEALIPGTAYLEMARAALELRPESRAVELRDVFFLAPFSVRLGETRELRLRLRRTSPSAAEFWFTSEAPDALHVTGRIAYVDAAMLPRENIGEVLARCTISRQAIDGFLDQPFVDFGPRWGNVRTRAIGHREALLGLELPAACREDLKQLRLHPALLDMATGAAQTIVPGFDQERDFYVPFSYGRVILLRSLPEKLSSHVRFKKGTQDFITFDVVIYDEHGGGVAHVTDFVMKRVDLAAAMRAETARAEPPTSKVTRVGTAISQGILPHEGIDALGRILRSKVKRQIVVSSIDLDDWLATTDAESQAHVVPREGATKSATTYERPNLSTNYVAPRDDVERELAVIWRDLLGVKEVGVHDDFFELGGQSLIAVRLFNKIRKKYGTDLPISTLFDAPTIAQTAVIVREEGGLAPLRAESTPAGPLRETHADGAEPESSAVRARNANGGAAQNSRWTSLVTMQGEGDGRPFFCVAGMGGTLNNLRKLSVLMGKTRRIYGLQPPGAAGDGGRLYEVEALAAHYVGEIRRVQPSGPYFVGGYSGGGVAAYEMARQLEREGEKVAFLGFLDSFSPALPIRPLVERVRIHARRARLQGASYVVGTFGRRLASETQALRLKLSRQLEKMFSERYRYDALKDSWVIAERRYRPEPWSGRATLFRAQAEVALSLWTAVEVSEAHGWERYLQGGVDVVICPGDHESMCEEPHVRVLAQRLAEALDRADAALRAQPGATDAPRSSALAP